MRRNTNKRDYKFTYFFQGEITEDSPGQGNIPTKVHRRVNEVQCSDEVMALTDELWQNALDNFSTASISLVTKQSAREFYQSILPQSSLSFHLQSARAPFISWERSDPRVSKEILKCKVLTGSASQCFSIQSTKAGEGESKRLLIEFSHVVGLEINRDSIVMDVASTPKLETKIHAKPVGKTASGGKWLEQSLQVVGHKKPCRIKLLLACGKEPGATNLREMLNKVSSLKRAIDGGLANVYDLCDDANENPEERYPIVQDPSLVRAAQMASLRLLHTLPSTNKAEYVIKMYGSMERRFNHLLQERTTCAQKAHKLTH